MNLQFKFSKMKKQRLFFLVFVNLIVLSSCGAAEAISGWASWSLFFGALFISGLFFRNDRPVS